MKKTQNNSNGLLPVITGLLIIEARNSNPNGDPDNDGAPRIRPDGIGEISAVSLKRKMRDLVGNKTGPVWLQIASELDLDGSGYDILEERGRDRAICQARLESGSPGFWDGALFGNTFLEEKENGGSDTMRCGALQLGIGLSLAPIDCQFATWTNKSGVEADKDRGMAPNAQKLVVHGLYALPFFVNPTAGLKSGCTLTHVNIFLALIKYVCSHTASVTRPMVDIIHAHTFTHNDPCGSCRPLALIDALTPKKLGDPTQPSISVADYCIPQWADVSGLVARQDGKTYAECGTYQDYAQF
jgi:CRISPR-associated protein Csd2